MVDTKDPKYQDFFSLPQLGRPYLIRGNDKCGQPGGREGGDISCGIIVPEGYQSLTGVIR